MEAEAVVAASVVSGTGASVWWATSRLILRVLCAPSSHGLLHVKTCVIGGSELVEPEGTRERRLATIVIPVRGDAQPMHPLAALGSKEEERTPPA